MPQPEDNLNSIRYLVEVAGRRLAVRLELTIWEQIVAWLEDLDDEAALRDSLAAGDDLIDWEQAKKQLQSDGVDL